MNESVLKLLSANLQIASDELENERAKEDVLEINLALAAAKMATLQVKDAVDKTINALQTREGKE